MKNLTTFILEKNFEGYNSEFETNFIHKDDVKYNPDSGFTKDEFNKILNYFGPYVGYYVSPKGTLILAFIMYNSEEDIEDVDPYFVYYLSFRCSDDGNNKKYIIRRKSTVYGKKGKVWWSTNKGSDWTAVLPKGYKHGTEGGDGKYWYDSFDDMMKRMDEYKSKSNILKNFYSPGTITEFGIVK